MTLQNEIERIIDWLIGEDETGMRRQEARIHLTALIQDREKEAYQRGMSDMFRGNLESAKPKVKSESVKE